MINMPPDPDKLKEWFNAAYIWQLKKQNKIFEKLMGELMDATKPQKKRV